MSATIDGSAVRARLKHLRRQTELRTHEALRRAARVAEETAKRLAPGRLPETMRVRLLNQYAMRVYSTSPIALYQDQGTKPHVIVPKAARAMRFTQQGAVIFTRRVRHPGNKALHFMSIAAEAGKAELRRLMSEILR